MNHQTNPLIACFLWLCLTVVSTHNQSNAETLKTSITLAPHITELVYSAGASHTLQGVSAYSDYPADALNKPIIGDAFHLNLELITQLNPDVVFYWAGGTPKQTIEKLKSMQMNLVAIEINQLTDIPKAIQHIAETIGSKPVKATDEFLVDLTKLKSREPKPQSALIQISDQPIFTVNGDHWMTESIGVCGLDNVFADLDAPSAAVTLESVVLSKPDVIIRIEAMTAENQLSAWNSIPAIKNQHIAVLNADHFTRPTLRTLMAIESLCDQLNQF